ncbi:AGE family epimerase/isomerase [Eleftheria terrae]|uniref:AGE family epimerase/isomerase n=1 Tax=Eleftheria terrae TaxID=1597781 RepID=UPI00263B5850|nr:AGE family epimerase/isomerase [Eleftheria terrae]WKB52706.1 AGE family epimerase/isomerase [Eleftheria terrae]
MQTLPRFRSAAFLKEHIFHTMAFYHPHCIDKRGGYFQYFRDDQTPYDPERRRLVNSTRFIYNYAMAFLHFRAPSYLQAARHGLQFLREHHRHAGTGHYAWTLDVRDEADGSRRVQVVDDAQYAYGLAFVMLAYATALKAGITEAREWLDDAWQQLEQRFWDARSGLYADEAAADGRWLPYRGQNTTMHVFEALLAAHEATGEARFLDRAEAIGKRVTVELTEHTQGLVWERYNVDWQPDWDYHRDEGGDTFRPWGFRFGHQTEWAKLLLMLDRVRPQPWLLPRAQALFDATITRAWDQERGGMFNRMAPDGGIHDGRKFFWVQSETMAAAALLGQRTGLPVYWRWFDKLWSYMWDYLIDHEHGAYHHMLGPDNRPVGNDKSPTGKTDYHTLGTVYVALTALPSS